jgi:mannosyltransferase OCH1-like enzyme
VNNKLTTTEQTETARSTFVHELILEQVERETGGSNLHEDRGKSAIPRKILRYWHDPSDLPNDVRECLASWDKLADRGFEFFLHDDVSAAQYISVVYGEREQSAFARCSHPAMRSDYMRLCFIVEEGGVYVDADDVLIAEDCDRLFSNDRLKLQPLCYDISAGGMMSAGDIWNPTISSDKRNFYVNNDPLVAPAHHPLLVRALDRATKELLKDNPFPEIQATTGPGNLTMALVDHAKCLRSCGQPLDFEFLKEWDSIAEIRWELSYRKDERNWRNVYGC